MMHPHEVEEIEYRFGPKLWDAGVATGEVCCAAYQLGACAHTEDYDYEDEEDRNPVTREELVELYGEAFVTEAEAILARGAARRAELLADEPF